MVINSVINSVTTPVTTSHMDGAQPDVYRVRETPLGTAKHIRIVGIGAGASGLNMIRTLRLDLTNYEVTVYEKNAEVGGTWYENRYPGCRCDVPSHNYQFSWRPKHDWSNFHAPAEEIEEYLCELCDEEGMRDVIKTRHEITEFDDYAHFLLDGTGILNDWKWPDTEGIQTYEGVLIHSARWPKDFDSTGKTIVVIGNGATGVQLLPEIQPAAKKLYHVVRTPTWVLPPRIQSWKMTGQAEEAMSKIELDDRENFTQQTIDKFKSDPAYYRGFVKGTEKAVNKNFGIIVKDGPVQKFARAMATEYMTAMLGGDERLCKALIPEKHEAASEHLADFPNYFTFLGPNAPIGHGSVFTLTEHIAKYIVGIIAKCQTEGIRCIAPSRAAVDDYFEHISAFMPRTAWAGPGRSWFKGDSEEGPVTALHPGSRIHFFHMLEEFRGEDWEYVYDNPKQNRFEYLGNGFSSKELDPEEDPTWYLD
ncbi:hypothetical protein P8C59_007412 [Phyllachora maydis]|uniref:FAD/NAD(P)-binding domain-containing protein n=1 Tax=Phyllachora maydis TaxID=1825666 RepID=A0AAD9I8P4_9PEZI|nr:hypothetical protein P8C59_007412 [Phyllachora maydis]